MTSVILTQKQIRELAQLAKHFKEVDTFKIDSASTSGIGPTVKVSFDLFDNKNTTVDITDLDSW
jgi:hypothetical protein